MLLKVKKGRLTGEQHGVTEELKWSGLVGHVVLLFPSSSNYRHGLRIFLEFKRLLKYVTLLQLFYILSGELPKPVVV